MTYDGWWEMNHDPDYSANFARFSSRSVDWGVTETKKKDEFQPIPVRYGKKEWRLAKEGTGTDVLVQAGAEGFTANKITLMARSSFFRTMFTSSFKEGRDPSAVVHLQEMDPGIFKCLLRFMYTGTLSKKTQAAYSTDLSKLEGFLEQGDFLGLDGIGIWASEFLQRTLVGGRLIPDHVYTTLFEIALKMEDEELLRILLQHPDGTSSHTFAHAVGEASLSGLISKETWEKISRAVPISLYGEVRNIEDCNPYIRKLLHS